MAAPCPGSRCNPQRTSTGPLRSAPGAQFELLSFVSAKFSLDGPVIRVSDCRWPVDNMLLIHSYFC